MENKDEYHDPDYPEAPVCVKEEPPQQSHEEKIDKIKNIILREFSRELETRESEVVLIDERLVRARRYLHQLRYTLVNNYYNDQKLQLSSTQIQDDVSAQTEPRAKDEVSKLLRDSQRRIHPSVRKLLGKETADLDEILKFQGRRNKVRKDYSAMVRKNCTIPADSTTTSLRPESQLEAEPGPTTSKPKKIPRHIEPKVTNVVSLAESIRNQVKHRYRIIIGNTSKYAPPASRIDKSTHKWLLYIRGPANKPDVSKVITSVTATLHHSYAPHHKVQIDKPPFHISRRGWGEFPVKLELHFPVPETNRPAQLDHFIKLDRNYTGIQTLGAETVVDVWLYSTPEMLEFEYEETESEKQTDIQSELPTNDQIKHESTDTETNDDSWLDFFTKDSMVSVDDMLIKDIKTEAIDTKAIEDFDTNELPNNITQPWTKRIMKYIEPNTGKIYYLEMDRTLDLSTVQEIVINSKGSVKTAKISPVKNNGLKSVKKGVSLLKPLTNETHHRLPKHIENDHCYLSSDYYKQVKSDLDSIRDDLCKFTCVRRAVSYLLKRIPLISGRVSDETFVKCYPFVVASDDSYWKLDFAKRRNIEWSRAKLINKLLIETFKDPERIWRSKQILVYSRLHGYYAIREDKHQEEWMENTRTNIKEMYPRAQDINTLSEFNIGTFNDLSESVVQDSDEEIDVVSEGVVKVNRVVESEGGLSVLGVTCEETRLRYMYLERICADVGVELRNEDVGSGYSYSAVHAVLLSAMKSFAEELVRGSLAAALRQTEGPPVWCGTSRRNVVGLEHVYEAVSSSRELQHLTNTGLAATDKQTHAI